MSNAVANSLVCQHLQKVTPSLVSEFKLNCNLVSVTNLDTTLKVLLREFRDNPIEPKGDSLSNPLHKKLIENSVVYHQLMAVAPDIAEEFWEKHLCNIPVQISLRELVDKKSSIDMLNSSSPGDVQVITLSEEEVFDVSSSSETSSDEDEKIVDDEDIIDVSSSSEISSDEDEKIVDVSSSSESSLSEEDTDDEVILINEIKQCQSNNNKAKEVQPCKDFGEQIRYLNKEAKSKEVKTNEDKLASSKSLNKSYQSIDFSNEVWIEDSKTKFRNISESLVYAGLRKNLNADSVVDKIVLHILDEDIKISQLNFDLIITSRRVLKRNQYSIPDHVKIGGLSPIDHKTIVSNWNNLVAELNLSNPGEIFGQFCKRSTKEQRLKANVLGLYLSQGLQKLRLAADVFHHAEKKLSNFVRGKYSKTEGDLIMDYVSKHGKSFQTFKDIAKRLNRCFPESIRIYYFKQCADIPKVKGAYTAMENKVIINEILEKSNINTVLEIKKSSRKEGTVKKATFKEIAEKLGRPIESVMGRWRNWIKPILLQYHGGVVNFDIRKILVDFLLERNLIFSQDIPWEELLEKPQFIGQSRHSLYRVFSSLVKCTMQKFGCNREEVTIQQVATYLNENLNPAPKKQLALDKQKFIEYYRKLIEAKCNL